MVFQDPMTSLNPFLTVAQQLTEVTQLHLGYRRRQALDHAVEMLAPRRHSGAPSGECSIIRINFPAACGNG